MDWQKRKIKLRHTALLFSVVALGISAQEGDWEYEDIVTEEQGTEWLDSLEDEENEGESPDPVLQLDEGYNQSALDPAKVESSEWEKLKGDKEYTEADKEEEEAVKDPSLPSSLDFDPSILRWFIIALIAGVFIFLLVRFANVDRAFNRKVSSLDIEEIELAEDNLQESDLDRLLRLALEAKDYRAALRVRYLMVLKALDATGRIVHKKDKTNLNYILELKGKPEQLKFIELSRIFEYVWYAEVEVPESEEQHFALAFNTYLDTLHVSS